MTQVLGAKLCRAKYLPVAFGYRGRTAKLKRSWDAECYLFVGYELMCRLGGTRPGQSLETPVGGA